MDDSVRSTDQIKQITGIPVLSSVSYILTKSENRLRRLKIFGWLILIIVIDSAGLFFANKYLVNMEDLWSVVLERMKMIV